MIMQREEIRMETRIVEIEEFKVKGYQLKGPISQIPSKWEKLNAAIIAQGIDVNESFGVCISMEHGKIYYIAGIKSNLAEGLPDSEQVHIAGGRYAIATVEGGIPSIAESFNAIMKMPGIQLRDGYSLERYIHPEGSNIDQIEVWMPIM